MSLLSFDAELEDLFPEWGNGQSRNTWDGMVPLSHSERPQHMFFLTETHRARNGEGRETVPKIVGLDSHESTFLKLCFVRFFVPPGGLEPTNFLG
jgi:hypothetical protein